MEDLFVGGAKGQTSRIFFQQNDGTFKPLEVPVFIKDLYCENVDAAAFDADGDGDLDLYIVRGGNAVTVGNPLLEDRLLINNGKGDLMSVKKDHCLLRLITAPVYDHATLTVMVIWICLLVQDLYPGYMDYRPISYYLKTMVMAILRM